MENNRILEVVKVDSDSRRCNACLGQSGGVYELSVGRNRQSITIALCRDCMEDLATMLWEHPDLFTKG